MSLGSSRGFASALATAAGRMASAISRSLAVAWACHLRASAAVTCRDLVAVEASGLDKAVTVTSVASLDHLVAASSADLQVAASVLAAAIELAPCLEDT